MTQCPDHERVVGATLGNCPACARETTPPERAAELAAQVRRAMTRPPRTTRAPEPPPTDLRAARERADTEEPA